MPRLCVLRPSGDGIDVSHKQACTGIAKLAEFECDLLHIAELNSSPLACFSGTCDGRDAVPHRKITALMQRGAIKCAGSLACSRMMRNNRPRTGEAWVRAM